MPGTVMRDRRRLESLLTSGLRAQWSREMLEPVAARWIQAVAEEVVSRTVAAQSLDEACETWLLLRERQRD